MQQASWSGSAKEELKKPGNKLGDKNSKELGKKLSKKCSKEVGKRVQKKAARNQTRLCK